MAFKLWLAKSFSSKTTANAIAAEVHINQSISRAAGIDPLSLLAHSVVKKILIPYQKLPCKV
jgi:hypothetical protein